ncbi:hypothetical protein FNV43_RR08184 [Rhamnella rubrinervis]|uniref:Ubiquitin-like protease family profile domain-containing protein n=1 Tax=Rhamnella rubrinervis TaxID=2594499 RepID=A0A8K0HHB4_9ROSA|nr:hypothetical protein FNV43_RR08184 [Rhamnella rubrinervis]
MASKKKTVANHNKRQVKPKPSKKTTSPELTATTLSTTKEVAPFVNLSNEVPKSFDDVPNTSNPQRATKLRKYIVNANSQDDPVKLTNYGNFSNAVDVVRRKLGDDGVKAFKNTCFGHFLDVKSMSFSSDIVHSILMRDLPDTLWDKYFGVRGTLEQKEFINKFERYPFNEMEVEDNTKVCMFYLLEYPVHNQLHFTTQEKKEAYIISFFRSIAYRSYDGPPSVFEDVDDTTVDPPSEQVQPDHRTPIATASTSHAPHPVTAPYATSEDVAWLENKLDDLNRKVQLIMQHLGIEAAHERCYPVRASSEEVNCSWFAIHTVIGFGHLHHPPLVDLSASTGDIPTLMCDLYWAVEENCRTLLMNILNDSSRPSHGVDIMVLNKSSFHTLLISGAWLHSDESFYYLFEVHAPVMQKKYIHLSERLPISSHDWTLDKNDDTVTNYVKGISPLLSHSWKDVDHVYVPVNNEDKHWLVVDVDLVRRHVTLYDSSCSASND